MDTTTEFQQNQQNHLRSSETANINYVDLMETLEPFSYRDKFKMAKHAMGIELTDGCIGCPWCGLPSKKGFSNAISIESFEKFATEHKRFMTDRGLLLYYRSDPFLWHQGDNRYVDLVKIFDGVRTEMPKEIFTSTSVPAGTEQDIVTFLLYEYEKWSRELLRTSPFRFSVIPDDQPNGNHSRIEQIYQELLARGVQERFINRIKQGNYDISGSNILKIGRAFGREGRDEIKDSVGIACYDGVLLTTSGPCNIGFEAATEKNTSGLVIDKIDPRNAVVNRWVHSSDYLYHSFDNYYPIFLLPYLRQYGPSENGLDDPTALLKSVRRDALTFKFALINLEKVTDQINRRFIYGPAKERVVKFIKGEFTRQFEARKASCQELIRSSDDPQADRVAQHFIHEVEKNIDQLVGIDPRLA